jgi:hypothetical protein
VEISGCTNWLSSLVARSSVILPAQPKANIAETAHHRRNPFSQNITPISPSATPSKPRFSISFLAHTTEFEPFINRKARNDLKFQMRYLACKLWNGLQGMHLRLLVTLMKLDGTAYLLRFTANTSIAFNSEFKE